MGASLAQYVPCKILDVDGYRQRESLPRRQLLCRAVPGCGSILGIRREDSFSPTIRGIFFGVSKMLDQYLNINTSLSYIYQNYLTCLGIFWHIVGLILGGLAIWSGLIIAKFVSRHSSPYRRRR